MINITFKPGSDGSLISGLSFLRDDGSIPEIEFDTVSNIIIERSLFKPNERHFAFLQSSNINIRQNYFSGSDYLVSTSYLFYANSNPGVTNLRFLSSSLSTVGTILISIIDGNSIDINLTEFEIDILTDLVTDLRKDGLTVTYGWYEVANSSSTLDIRN